MSNTTRFERLFQPIRLGEMEIKNRFVMASMGTNSSTKDGFVTEQMKAYYEERARGGAGLILIENVSIDAISKNSSRRLLIVDDKYIPGLSELASVIQKRGPKAALQLHHAGRLAKEKFTGYQPVAPSAIPMPGGEMPRELSIAEIEEVVDQFAQGAERAQKAGFDGVEIQACHGHLLTSFLSADSNKRQDAYGGPLRNRAKMLLDVVNAVRKKVGAKYPVWVRLCAEEFHTNNGINLDEARQVARWLEEAGVVALNVSADYHRAHFGMAWPIEGEKLPRPPCAHPHGMLIPWAAEIKKVVNIPIMIIGWMTPEVGEQALREGKIDMVAMARPLLADPKIPNKTASGRLDEIRPCIGCLMCREQISINKTIACSVNGSAGREYDSPIVPAKKKKRVVVVGGGPAGLEAARVAALRGHDVTLFDKGTRLGGQLLIAALPPHKAVLAELANYLAIQVKRLGVKVESGKEATPQAILSAKPDAVVIASGVTHPAPNIPGIKMAKVVEAADVLTGKAKVGKIVVVMGGGVVGGETAEFLAEKGKKVTIIEMLEDLAAGMENTHKQHLLDRLNLLGVTILMKTKGVAVQEEGMVVSTEGGPNRALPADTIVLATGARPNQELYRELSGKVSEIHLVGDSVEPRRIFEATAEGFHAGHTI